MEKPKRRYTNAGGRTRGAAHVEFNMYWSRPDSELVSVKCASLVLNVKLQAVVQLGLPRYMVEKRAVYRKGDIQALLLADHAEPNALLRALQEEHRQVQVRQEAHPSTRYRSVIGDLLPDEAVAARETTKINRKKALTQDERSGGWDRRLPERRNAPLGSAKPVPASDVPFVEVMRAWVKDELKKDGSKP